jgi:hypothetical protein
MRNSQRGEGCCSPTRPGRSRSEAIADAGLTAAIGATLPAAAWRRSAPHCAANLMSATPEASWPWGRARMHSVYDQPDAASVHAHFDRILDGGGLRPHPSPHRLTTTQDHAATHRNTTPTDLTFARLSREGDASAEAEGLKNRIHPEPIFTTAEEVSVFGDRYERRVAGGMSERGWDAFPGIRVVSWHEAVRGAAATGGPISAPCAGPS